MAGRDSKGTAKLSARLRCLALMATLPLLGACEQPREGPPTSEELGVPPLSAAEARIFLRDATLTFETEERTRYLYLREDGSMSGRSVDPKTKGADQASGFWQVDEDGLLCREWSNGWERGASGCAKVYRFGDNYLFVHESGGLGEETEYRGKREAGNTEGL
ncbi:MAG: hypothetical protein AAGI34_06215 [Pseudomonadota bacterium]